MVFRFFSSPRSPAKNLSTFCLLSLVLRCLLAYPHCSFTRWLSAWADTSSFWSSIWVRSPVNQGWLLQLVPGDKPDQRSHDTRGPVNSQTELLGPFASPLTLAAESLYHSHCCSAQWEVLRNSPSLLLGSPSPSSQKTGEISQRYTHFLMRKQQRHVFLFCLQQLQMTISQLLLQKHARQLNLFNCQSF